MSLAAQASELSWPHVLVGLLFFVMFVCPLLGLLAWCYEASDTAFRRARAEVRRYRRTMRFHHTGIYTWTPQPFAVTQVWRHLRRHGTLPKFEFANEPILYDERRKLEKEREKKERADAAARVTAQAEKERLEKERLASAERAERARRPRAVPTAAPQPVAATSAETPTTERRPSDDWLRVQPDECPNPQVRPQTPPRPPEPAHQAVPTSQPVRWRGDQESHEIVMRLVREQPGGLNASDLARKVRAEHSKAGGRKNKPPSDQTIRRLVRQMETARLIVPVSGGSRPRYDTPNASGQPGR